MACVYVYYKEVVHMILGAKSQELQSPKRASVWFQYEFQDLGNRNQEYESQSKGWGAGDQREPVLQSGSEGWQKPMSQLKQ